MFNFFLSYVQFLFFCSLVILFVLFVQTRERAADGTILRYNYSPSISSNRPGSSSSSSSRRTATGYTLPSGIGSSSSSSGLQEGGSSSSNNGSSNGLQKSMVFNSVGTSIDSDFGVEDEEGGLLQRPQPRVGSSFARKQATMANVSKEPGVAGEGGN